MAKLTKAYALLIGVGNDLPVTVRDATAIRNILADEEYAGYLPENIHLLTEKQATRENILSSFDQLIEKAEEDSSVLIYYSGHGGTYLDNDILYEHEKKPEEENHRHFYLLPNNFDAENYDETWVTASEIKNKIGEIKSRRLVFFLDCCHAAGITKSSNLAVNSIDENKFRQPEAMAQKIEDGQGISIISSCREDQQSYILDGDANSLFTRCLVEVLKGKHKKVFTEPYIRVTEVTQYLFRRIPELIDNQKPYVNLQIYDDFVLSRVPQALIQMPEEEVEQVRAEIAKAEEVKTVYRKSDKANSVILFVHGFTGEGANTFGNIPDLIMNDERFAGWDLYPLGYTVNVSPDEGKQVWASRQDVEMMADFLSTSIKNRFSDYNRVAIITHGLGGLVTQEAILNLPESFVKKISHLLLFCSPNGGLPTKKVEHLAAEFAYLRKDGDYIKTIRRKWQEKFDENYPFKLHLVAATEDEYIPAESNVEAIPNAQKTILRGNHFSIVKPKMGDESYDLIEKALLNNQFLQKVTTPEEVNITIGEYRKVVDSLLPKKDQLDFNGIKLLCFALEGLDREQEVFEILDTYKDEAKIGGQVSSLLAGRFKRLYLKEFTNEDALHAIELYQQGLRFAEESNNSRDIYYNAINLAFLYAVYGRNFAAMNECTAIAKEALQNNPFPSLWKIATEAECALYEANFDLSKEKYKQAAAMAGVRERLSMYTNAYTAYTHIMNTQSEDDPFISFLNKTLL